MKKVKYTAKVLDENTGEVSYETRSIDVDIQSVRIFSSFWEKIEELPRNYKRLLFYFLQDDFVQRTGHIFNNTQLYKKYSEYRKSHGLDGKYFHSEYYKDVKGLVEHGFMYKKTRGVYVLSPRYIYMGDINKRYMEIKKEMEAGIDPDDIKDFMDQLDQEQEDNTNID